MKIIVDQNLCVGCGTCVAICPACFKLTPAGKAEVIGEAECAAQAASSCPEAAITVE